MTENEALVVLNAVPGLGSVGIKKLYEYYGSAVKILDLNEEELRSSAMISSRVIGNIFNFPKDKFLKNEYNLMCSKGVDVISMYDSSYPVVLRELYDAPVVLYIKGRLPKDIETSVAIVGSRKASVYGIMSAGKMAAQLAEAGLIIISGMARGIDTAAHLGTLKNGGCTIAVLGCGLSHVYPAENKNLMERISETGAVISEFPMQMKPLPYNFPRRNRIVSGLSMGVIVVEAMQRSGALITADFALEQGKEVYAIPGNIDSPFSFGVNRLIKQGAKLITGVTDVLEDLKPQMDMVLRESPWESNDVVAQDISLLSDETQQILNVIGATPIHFDEILVQTGLSISQMEGLLMESELSGRIRQIPGKYYKKN